MNVDFIKVGKHALKHCDFYIFLRENKLMGRNFTRLDC